jgi:hypothetical protein
MDANGEEVRRLKLELLGRQDELIGLRAEDVERRFRFLLLKRDYRDLGKEFEEQTLVLRENMTRAYEAEKELLELRTEIDRLKLAHSAEVASIHASRSWRIARVLVSPLRLFRSRQV